MTTETQWAARKFWRDTYVSGVRITFNGGEFRFFRCLWPSRLRVETFGKFGHFPVEPMQPTAELCAALEPHKAELATFLGQEPPRSLAEHFWHLLSRDYEFFPLQIEAARIGIALWGFPLDGGLFPVIVKGKPFYDDKERPPSKPQILIDYLKENENGRGQKAIQSYS